MDEHPISLNKAKELLAGDLGDVYRRILADSCVPIYWFNLSTRDFAVASRLFSPHRTLWGMSSDSS